MAVEQRMVTVQQYLEIAQSPDNAEKRLELVDGEIIEMPGSSPRNTVIAARIVHFLSAYVMPNDLGYVTCANGGFLLGEGEVRRPDVGFVRKGRTDLSGAVFQGAPDLAVEVISPSESARYIHDQARAYLEAGASLVWAVFPEDQVVDVYRLTSDGHLDVEKVEANGTLSGDDVLPGFTLAVQDIFENTD